MKLKFVRAGKSMHAMDYKSVVDEPLPMTIHKLIVIHLKIPNLVNIKLDNLIQTLLWFCIAHFSRAKGYYRATSNGNQ